MNAPRKTHELSRRISAAFKRLLVAVRVFFAAEPTSQKRIRAFYGDAGIAAIRSGPAHQSRKSNEETEYETDDRARFVCRRDRTRGDHHPSS
jgi:hypothetical protein